MMLDAAEPAAVASFRAFVRDGMIATEIAGDSAAERLAHRVCFCAEYGFSSYGTVRVGTTPAAIAVGLWAGGMRMTRFVGFLVLVLSALAAGLPALAQSGGVQLRLTNRMTEKVDYYVVPPGGKPTFAGSVEAGAVVDVESKAGQGYVFAVNRVPFQKYTTRSEVFQGLTLAPQGQQKPPVVANSRQKPVSGGKTIDAATADSSGGGGSAPSDDGLIWMFSQFQDDRGVDTSVLYFSVPETDNVQFSAACSAQDATPRVILSADVSRMKNGAVASVRFLASGFDATMKGKVRRSESGESQDGVDMAIGAADPLWQAFGVRNAMNYSVQGQAPLRLPLAGIQEPLGNFLRDCAQFASGGVVGDATQLFSGGTGGGSANTAGATADSCAALDGVVSKNGGKTVAVEFVNRTDEYRVLLWIDFDGTPVEYTQLEAGQAYQVETSSAHPWMVTDGPGNCIEKFMPKPGQSRILISRKSPGFGDE